MYHFNQSSITHNFYIFSPLHVFQIKIRSDDWINFAFGWWYVGGEEVGCFGNQFIGLINV
jgi:hypothetical protein